MPLLHRNSISKARLDALADAMFGVAMTLLVIDIRLPESFDPKSGAELWHAITELQSKFLVYLITFFVVGLRWLGNSRLAAGQDTVTEAFARWTLLHLFLITCLPFSTMLIGRYDDLAPAVWIYAANMAFAAMVSIRLNTIADIRAGIPKACARARARCGFWSRARCCPSSSAFSIRAGRCWPTCSISSGR